MSDPERLLEGGGDELELALLRSARTDAPPGGARNRAMVALGVGAAAGALTVKASAAAGVGAAARMTALSVMKWIGIGMIGGAATMGVVEAVAPSSTPVAPAAAPVAASHTIVPREPQPLHEAPAVTASATASTARPTADSPRQPTAPAEQPAAPSRSLADEVAALDRARVAVASGDGPGALEALNQYQREFPQGLLGPEAVVLRIEALSASGDREGARSLGQRFLERNPASPHASRIRTLIGVPSIP